MTRKKTAHKTKQTEAEIEAAEAAQLQAEKDQFNLDLAYTRDCASKLFGTATIDLALALYDRAPLDDDGAIDRAAFEAEFVENLRDSHESCKELFGEEGDKPESVLKHYDRAVDGVSSPLVNELTDDE